MGRQELIREVANRRRFRMVRKMELSGARVRIDDDELDVAVLEFETVEDVDRYDLECLWAIMEGARDGLYFERVKKVRPHFKGILVAWGERKTATEMWSGIWLSELSRAIDREGYREMADED